MVFPGTLLCLPASSKCNASLIVLTLFQCRAELLKPSIEWIIKANKEAAIQPTVPAAAPQPLMPNPQPSALPLSVPATSTAGQLLPRPPCQPPQNVQQCDQTNVEQVEPPPPPTMQTNVEMSVENTTDKIPEVAAAEARFIFDKASCKRLCFFMVVVHVHWRMCHRRTL